MHSKGKVVLLADKSLNELNVDISKLNDGSHQKVFVQCTRCSEIFKREYRNLYQQHNCPTHTTRDDGVKLKWCNSCNQFLAYTNFSNNITRPDGLSSICKACLNLKSSSKQKHTKMTLMRKTNFDYWLKSKLSQKQSDCKKRGIQFSLTFDDMKNKWYSQNGKCFYFKIPLSFTTKNLNSAQFDRLDPQKGYTVDNVVFASKISNNAKNDSKMDDFKSLFSYIIANFDDRPRFEVINRSDKAKLPFRERSTDAGYDIYSIDEYVINPNETVNVDTGLSIVAPPGYYYTIEGRSSLYKNGVMPMRGIIDGGYSGLLMVSLTNVSKTPYKIKIHDRIAQIIPHKIVNVDFINTQEVSDGYNIRGQLGYGSSGR